MLRNKRKTQNKWRNWNRSISIDYRKKKKIFVDILTIAETRFSLDFFFFAFFLCGRWFSINSVKQIDTNFRCSSIHLFWFVLVILLDKTRILEWIVFYNTLKLKSSASQWKWIRVLFDNPSKWNNTLEKKEEV